MTTFAAIFVPEPLRRATSDDAWLAAMLEAERALAAAEARAGAISAEAAEKIAAACRPELYDAAALGEQGRADGNPVIPLVRALRQQVADEATDLVHFAATSQDVLDTAAMLVARTARGLILDELAAAAAACAQLAEAHRSTPMSGRTLLQQAVPTTFGAKAAGWLVGLLNARRRLAAVELQAQLGGAAGTLAPLRDAGAAILGLYAAELGLAEPTLPWHAHRAPVTELAAALDGAAAACAKIGLDVVLLAQTEVAEVAEASSGGSSTMPHKQNPVRAVLARSCARLAHAAAGVLTGGDHEHERAAGAWQAEWPALSATLAFSGGAAAAARECLDGLRVDAGRMAANMTADLYAERDAFVQRGLIEHDEAYLGSAVAFVDRALARHREEAP